MLTLFFLVQTAAALSSTTCFSQGKFEYTCDLVKAQLVVGKEVVDQHVYFQTEKGIVEIVVINDKIK